jgi:D-alanyl-D-alanine dipeptidase
MKKLIHLGLIMLLATPVYALENNNNPLPKGFVYLEDIDPTIDQKVEFATDNNILGVPADGYEAGRAICTKETALVLVNVQKKLKKKGLCLRVCDAYRPARAVEHIKSWARDLSDQKTKARYYPNISKEDILGTFVAANRSSHSRGSTVDVLLVDDATKEPLDFGPDGFGEESFTYCSTLTKEQQANRLMLRKIMLTHGFKPYNKEFWHFTLKDEPFPETYFDFPVR